MTTRMMTTQRLARASRSRFFIGLAVLLLTVGFVAVFHSTQQELQQLHQLEARCEQQQQTLAQQLTAHELSAKSERLEHHQTKIDMLRRCSEDKKQCDRTMMESNLKFGALQQSYKLLKSQNDDLVDECGKLRGSHLEQLSAVETKLKNIAAQQALFERQKARDAEDSKIKIRQLEERIEQLQQQLAKANGNQSPSDTQLSLQRQLDAYQSHCQWRPATATNVAQAPLRKPTFDGVPDVDHNFNAQHPIVPKRQSPLDAADAEVAPAAGRPPPAAMSSTTVRSAAAHGPRVVQSAASAASAAATATPTTTVTKPKRARQIPAGVVPIRDIDDEMLGALNAADDGAVAATSIATATAGGGVATSQENNNRYANVLANNGGAIADGLENEADANVANEEGAVSAARPAGGVDAVAAGGDVDNGAHEVMDTNVFLVDGHSVGHKDHMQLVLEDRKLGDGGGGGVRAGAETNNAAEDDDGNAVGAAGRNDKDENEEDNAILGGRQQQPVQAGRRDAAAAANGGARKMPSDAKLLHEIAADGGKVAGYQDDAHLEDVLEEEGDDDDEYANLAARNADPAVRN